MLWAKGYPTHFLYWEYRMLPQVSTTDTRYECWPLLSNFTQSVHLHDPSPSWSAFFLSDFLIYFLCFSVLHLFTLSHPNFLSLCSIVHWIPLLCMNTVCLVALPNPSSSFLILLVQTIEGLYFRHWTVSGWVLANGLPARISFFPLQ